MLFRKFNVWTHSKRTSPLQDLRPLDTSTRGARIRSGAFSQNTLRGLRPVDTSRICALRAGIGVCRKFCTHPQHRGFEQSFGCLKVIECRIRSECSLFPPNGFQVPVNGDVDGQAGRFEEVCEQIPLDNPRLGDAHLYEVKITTKSLLFELVPPLSGKMIERMSRLSGSSTLPLGRQSLLPKPYSTSPLYSSTLDMLLSKLVKACC